MYYRLRPTASAVPLAEGRLLLKSDTQSVRLEGDFARLLQTTILPGLDGRLDVSEIARRLSLPIDALDANFTALVDSGLFESSPEAFPAARPDVRYNLLTSLGIDREAIDERLRSATIAVFGLDGLGAAIAEQLAIAGFERLRLVDPFPAAGSDFLADETAVEASREELIRARLRRRHPQTQPEPSRVEGLDRQLTRELMEGCDLAIAAWDPGMSSGNHWVNRASHELGVPALFCELRGVSIFAGPFVVPGMTACYMCARMRAVAAEDEYEEAMAYERHLDQLKEPAHEKREIFPTAIATLASLIATEAVKLIVLNHQPALLGAVVEYDPFDLSLDRHALLEQPSCPVCSEKKTYSRVYIPAWKSSADKKHTENVSAR